MPEIFDASLACGSADRSCVTHTSHQHPAVSQSTFRAPPWDTSATSAVSQGPQSSKMQSWCPQGHTTVYLGLLGWDRHCEWEKSAEDQTLSCVTDGPWHTEICSLNGCWCYNKVIYQSKECSFLKTVNRSESIYYWKGNQQYAVLVSYRGSRMH